MTKLRLPGTRAAGSETKRQQRTIEGHHAKTTSTETLVAALHSPSRGPCLRLELQIVDHPQDIMRIPAQSSDCEQQVDDGSYMAQN